MKIPFEAERTSTPLGTIAGNMNEIVSQSANSFLKILTAEQLDGLFEMSKRAKLDDLVESLKEHGIKTSDTALSRYFKKRRAQELVESGKEVAASVEALAEQGRGGKLREGTLEVLRQSFFEKAAEGQSPEEARELYDALVKEEGRVKELELEARKVAALEQQVKLQERRIEVEAMKARAVVGRVRIQVVGGKEVSHIAGEEVALIGEGEAAKGGTACASGTEGGSAGVEEAKPKLGEPGPKAERLLEVVKVVEGVLNRGGDPGERILEARGLLAEEIRRWTDC